jgi:hypothetical protein
MKVLKVQHANRKIAIAFDGNLQTFLQTGELKRIALTDSMVLFT